VVSNGRNAWTIEIRERQQGPPSGQLARSGGPYTPGRTGDEYHLAADWPAPHVLWLRHLPPT
jgi:hypothetical protein